MRLRVWWMRQPSLTETDQLFKACLWNTETVAGRDPQENKDFIKLNQSREQILHRDGTSRLKLPSLTIYNIKRQK